MKAIVAALIAVCAIGCKSGAGERCQVTSDCTSPLICNMATQTCADMTGGGIDALPPVLVDAPYDAPPDAPPPDTM